MTTRKWGTEFTVNTTISGFQDSAVVTALSDGGFMVAWRDTDPTIDVIRMQRFDALGAKTGLEFIPFDDASGVSGSQPDLVQLADGNIWFQATRGSFGAASSDGQVVDLTGADVRDQYLSVTESSQDPALTSLGSSGSAGVYQANFNANPGDILLDIYDGAGNLVVNDQIVNTNSAGSLASLQEKPDVAANSAGNRIAVVWADTGLTGADVRCRVFDNSGAQVAAEFTVNSSAGNIAVNQTQPTVVWLDDEKFAVAWVSQDDGQGDPSVAVKFSIFSATGVRLVPEQLVNSTTRGSQYLPTAAALPDGGFAIAWADDDPLTFGDIRLQAFDGAGVRRGTEILVNTETSGAQASPSLAALKDGRLVVTWSTPSGDIGAQIIDPRDGLVNGTVDGNDTLYGHDAVGDELSGYGGNDTLNGLGGTDVGYGGAGDDRFNGGRGDDTAYGGLGNDDLRGNTGEDALFGELGNDTIRGASGDDELNGGGGNDTLLGGSGSDVLAGGAGKDTASYSEANAGVSTSLDGSITQAGDASGDTYSSVENLTGSDFADTLAGNTAANGLNGGTGNDRLTGGAGKDTQTGGTGNDTFVFNASSEGGDTITGFSQVAGNNDRFELKASGFGGGLVAGALLASQFQDTNTNAAANGNVRVIYNQSTGQLFFDVDGNGGTAAVLLATLTNNANLALGDFTIV